MWFFLSAFIVGAVLGWFLAYPILEAMKNGSVKYKLTVPPRKGTTVPEYYYASTVIGLLWSMFSHRFGHWRRGEGFSD